MTVLKDAILRAKGTISDFQKREVDGFYPKREGLTSFGLGLTRVGRQGKNKIHEINLK
jgi:hypothetical protein